MAGSRGVRQALVEPAIAAYDRIIGLDLSEVAVDGSLHKAPCGGEGTGPNPTDRDKLGWKWSVATDLFEIPIRWVIDGANRNDSILLEPTLQAVADRGLLPDVQTLHLDRGYDSNFTTERCHNLGLTDIVCAKEKRKGESKVKKPLTFGLRWPVERTNSWSPTSASSPQHRPIPQTAPRPDRTRHRPHPDRQTRQMGQALDRPHAPIPAR